MTRDRFKMIERERLETDTIGYLTRLVSEFRATTPDEEQILTQAGQLRSRWIRHTQVQAGISVLLAGIGAGLQGSTANRALDIIQGKINQNIGEQKRRILTNADTAGMQSTDSCRDTEQPLPTHHHGDDMRPCPICSK